MTDTTTDPFSSPAQGGDRIPLDDVNGSLLLFTVRGVEKDIQTSFGPSDAVKCDVAALDGNNKGETWDDTLIFPRVLRSQLASREGGMVLGRLGKGTAKPGQSAPWLLADPTDTDKETGRKYLAHVETTKPPTEEPF